MQKQSRFVEIDALRTVAVFLMIVYHLVFDLAFFYGEQIEVLSGFWWHVAQTSATLFLLLMGISFALSKKQFPHASWRKYIGRGLRIFGCGMLVSAITFFLNPDIMVHMGVLHCIGISLCLLPYFYRFGAWNFLLGAACMLWGQVLKAFSVDHLWLLPIGVKPEIYQTLDYFPLFPWFGVILIGVGMGCIVYRTRTQGLLSSSKWLRQWTLPGRHSLWIYFIHQPVILGVLWVLYRIG